MPHFVKEYWVLDKKEVCRGICRYIEDLQATDYEVLNIVLGKASHWQNRQITSYPIKNLLFFLSSLVYFLTPLLTVT